MKQPVFSGYFWRKWGSFGGGKIQNFDGVKGENCREDKKTWGYFAQRQTLEEKHRIILRGYFFCLKPKQLGFLVAFGKKTSIVMYLCIYYKYVTYIYNIYTYAKLASFFFTTPNSFLVE